MSLMASRACRIIWRFRMFRLKVGVEAVGFQRVVRHLLLRELPRKRDAEGNITTDGSGTSITWLRTDNVMAISRTRAEGPKTAWVRDSIGPLVQSGALLFNHQVRGARAMLTALEGFPISRVGADVRDSLAMHLALLDRVPLSPNFRAATKARERARQAYRHRNAGPSGYGF